MKLFLAIALLSTTALADTVTLDWTIGWKWVNPDGTPRPVIVVNDQWPPPTVTVNEGDRLVVHVTNKLWNETTSIHFHGMYLKGSPEMDGASGSHQCPIPPASTFTYDFNVDQVGTYWWHAHNKAQIIDGLRGAMVVNPKKAPWQDQVDGRELVITLGDWYHRQAPYLIREYARTGAEILPNSALINNGQDTQFLVQPGKTYLLRVTNIGNAAGQYFQIDGHDLTIVEADGIYVEPYKVDQLYLAVSQRYAVLLTAKPAPVGNYLIKCQVDVGLFPSLSGGLSKDYYGYLTYDSYKPLPLKVPLLPGAPPFDDIELVTSTANQYEQVEAYDRVDQQIILDLDVTTIDGQIRATINNSTYLTQRVPTLYTALTTSSAALNPLVYGLNSNPYLVSPGQVVEILLINHDHRPHPFHLHGHTFQLIARSSSPPPSPLPTLPLSFTPVHPRPLRRDTVVLPAKGFIAIRFLADNPGVHLFHCHIEFHVEAGMTASIIESPEEMQKTVRIPEDHLEVCRRQGTKTEGNAAGRTGGDVLDLRGAVTRPDREVKGAVVGPLVPEGSDWSGTRGRTNGRWTPRNGAGRGWRNGSSNVWPTGYRVSI